MELFFHFFLNPFLSLIQWNLIITPTFLITSNRLVVGNTDAIIKAIENWKFCPRSEACWKDRQLKETSTGQKYLQNSLSSAICFPWSYSISGQPSFISRHIPHSVVGNKVVPLQPGVARHIFLQSTKFWRGPKCPPWRFGPDQVMSSFGRSPGFNLKFSAAPPWFYENYENQLAGKSDWNILPVSRMFSIRSLFRSRLGPNCLS